MGYTNTLLWIDNSEGNELAPACSLVRLSRMVVYVDCQLGLQTTHTCPRYSIEVKLPLNMVPYADYSPDIFIM